MAGITATRADVARLLGRVAFGATAADLDTWTGKRYADLVESLLTAAPLVEVDDLRRVLSSFDRTFGNERESFDIGQLRRAQGWWLQLMTSTAAPLRERMTLLWHGHFATARKSPYPDTAMLVDQNQTIRTHALGNFRDLVLAMNTDPAMLWWLDGTTSSRPVANENYGRELFELFTLGKFPQVYGEHDIREAARALTGWQADPTVRQPSFDANRHDAGRKRVLGRDIANLAELEHEAVVDAALAQPVAPRFIAYKLVRELAYDPGRADLLRKPDSLVARVAAALGAKWDIAAAVRTLLLSDEFRFASGPRQGVRQPVELVVHAAKAVGSGPDDDLLVAALAGMGQRLFDPANVGGWPFAGTWLSPVTTLARYQFAARMWELYAGNGFHTALPTASDLPAWAARFGMPGWTASTERAVRSFLTAKAKATEDERQAGVLILLLSSPDWLVL